MFQQVPKWRVDVTLPDGSERVLWMFDNFASNVFRKLADIQFTENGLTQPTRVSVGICEQEQQVGVFLPQAK